MFGLGIPEEYDGCGGDFLTYVLALEEISKVCASHGCIYSVNRAVGSAVFFNSPMRSRSVNICLIWLQARKFPASQLPSQVQALTRLNKKPRPSARVTNIF